MERSPGVPMTAMKHHCDPTDLPFLPSLQSQYSKLFHVNFRVEHVYVTNVQAFGSVQVYTENSNASEICCTLGTAQVSALSSSEFDKGQRHCSL